MMDITKCIVRSKLYIDIFIPVDLKKNLHHHGAFKIY